MMITGFYAGILGLMFWGLSVNVITNRLRHKIPYGDGDVSQLRQAIRAHGNFAEYIPMLLLMTVFVEFAGFNSGIVHALGALAVLSRVLHYFALTKSKNRVPAMLTTFITLIAASIFAILGFFGITF